MPNPLTPNTFLAQAGDLDDPVSNLNCYHEGCCNVTKAKITPSCNVGVGCCKICQGTAAGYVLDAVASYIHAGD